eukprot:gene11106-7732_t
MKKNCDLEDEPETTAFSIDALHSLRNRLTAPSIDQGHLFEGWPHNPRYYSDEQIDMLEELMSFGEDYEGGVEQYIINGRRLLDLSDQESEIFSGLEMPPLLYKAPSLLEQSDELDLLERTAEKALKRTVFVLVAGGMGERLGYSGAKVSLPMETATHEKYLEHYLNWAISVGGEKVPFVIMTSDETHQNTLQLIQELGFNGVMKHLLVLKQEAVFCFSDAAGHLALSECGKLIRKPHGHGDVHSLLYRAMNEDGVPWVDHWVDDGYQHIAFFQDTNSIITVTMPLAIAMSELKDLHMNFSCVPRRPKESIGTLCHVRKVDENMWRTVNVEYNIFEVVAQTLTREGCDRVSRDGGIFSPYPGSTNNLVMDLGVYRTLLKEHKGVVPEFINPKYTDATRRAFSKPARIESLMQDFAYFFKEEHRVGATLFERCSYQPVKNSMEEARKKWEQGISPFCAATGESDRYELMRYRLKAIGVDIGLVERTDITVQKFLPIQLFPIVVIDTAAAKSGMLRHLWKVFPYPEMIHISDDSTLIISGNVVVHQLRLEGALRIAGPKSKRARPLIVRHLNIRSMKWGVVPVQTDDPMEIDRMRGFRLEKLGLMEYTSEGLISEVKDPSKL